jgi:DNA modification methylase
VIVLSIRFHALQHERNYIGIELNPEYAKLSEDRIKEECPNTLVEHLSD